MIEPTMFREYDIRGHVNANELSDEAVGLIAKGFGTTLIRKGIKQVVIGFDNRESSEHFRDLFEAELASAGCNVVDIGMVLSPVLYFAQSVLGIPGGVMITASHNPPDWNGFKLSTAPATTLLGGDLQELLGLIQRGDFARGQGSVRRQPIKDIYIQDILSRVKLARRFRIVIDTGNGTAGAWAPDVFRAAGCDVDCLFCDLDPRFPNHFPNPSDLEGMKALQREVVAKGADLGLAFDGDGDRLGAVDAEGRVVYADRILILLARHVLSRQPGAKIVFDVKCTQALVDDVKAHGGVPIMWTTGHSYIKDKMRKEKAALAGERSGHICFPPDWNHPEGRPGPDYYYGIDDAIFAGLRMLEFLSHQTAPLQDLIREADPYITSPEIHVPCPDTRKYQIVDALVADFKAEYGDVIDINGARVSMFGGWGLVRASSNLPALVLVFEARNLEDLNRIKEVFRKKLAAHGCSEPWQGDIETT
jgi:phosphomannomutase/phosphoglucomutase